MLGELQDDVVVEEGAMVIEIDADDGAKIYKTKNHAPLKKEITSMKCFKRYEKGNSFQNQTLKG